MAIRIDPGLKRRIRERDGSFTIQVVGAPQPLALEALGRARSQIVGLDAGPDPALGLRRGDSNAPKYVSPVIPAQPGPILTINPGYVPVQYLLRIPTLVAAQLEAAGVTEAEVRELPQRPMDQRPKLYELGPAASLRLYPSPLNAFRRSPTPVPEAWLEKAFRWLTDEVGQPPPDLWATAHVAEFPIDWESAKSLMLAARAIRTVTWIRGGTLPHKASVIWEYGMPPSLVLQTGGPEYGIGGILAAAERLKSLARSLAPTLSVAMLSLAKHWPSIDSLPSAAGHLQAGYADPSLIHPVCDELLFDAYPYQIIGRGHIEWLGGVPGSARPLIGGRFELELGPLEAWLASQETRAEVLSRGRETLAPALRTADEVLQLLQVRRDHARRR